MLLLHWTTINKHHRYQPLNPLHTYGVRIRTRKRRQNTTNLHRFLHCVELVNGHFLSEEQRVRRGISGAARKVWGGNGMEGEERSAAWRRRGDDGFPRAFSSFCFNNDILMSPNSFPLSFMLISSEYPAGFTVEVVKSRSGTHARETVNRQESQKFSRVHH